jgi:hypothetical protein
MSKRKAYQFSAWQGTASRPCNECFAERGELHKPNCPKGE